MNIYIDESIHEKHGFMLLSYVLCKHDPQNDLMSILSDHAVDEFHSLDKMSNCIEKQILRATINNYLTSKCSFGVYVLPSSKRHNIYDEFFDLVSQLHNLFENIVINIYIDQGIINKLQAVKISSIFANAAITICDSKITKGIQLADLAVSLCGVMLREEVSGNRKILEYGPESGFDPPIKADLGAELWANLRYSIHRSSIPYGEDMPDMATFETLGYGYIPSKNLPTTLLEKANIAFSGVYLGCMH